MSAPALFTVGGAAQLTPAEAALLASHRAMNDAGRERLVSLASKLVERFQREAPPRLSLVRGAA